MALLQPDDTFPIKLRKIILAIAFFCSFFVFFGSLLGIFFRSLVRHQRKKTHNAGADIQGVAYDNLPIEDPARDWY